MCVCVVTLYLSVLPRAICHARRSQPRPFSYTSPQNHLVKTQVRTILKDYASALGPAVRSLQRDTSLLLERIPTLLTLLNQFPAFKSSNPQLMRFEDQKRLQGIVRVMSEEGLAWRQVKLPELAAYRYLLDPPLERLLVVSGSSVAGTQASQVSQVSQGHAKGHAQPPPPTRTPTPTLTPQDSHSYALCRLIASEMENLKIRKQKSKLVGVGEVVASGATTPSVVIVAGAGAAKRPLGVSASIAPEATKKVARDFFGRPVVVACDASSSTSADDGNSADTSTTASTSAKIPLTVNPIWYVQNDGVSNAVRRNIKVSSFFG